MTTEGGRRALAWAADLIAAADELGYSVVGLDGRKVILTELTGKHGATITIDSIDVSGDTLRRLLRPHDAPQT